MTSSRILLELVVVLGTAAVITVVFQALRLPVVLGYILAGLVIGYTSLRLSRHAFAIVSLSFALLCAIVADPK